ncbi:MAG: hypothetical protein R3B91_04755 [Planctomycetaceae bacterium]
MNLQRSFLCSYCVILLCVSCLIGQPLAADDAGALANTQAGTPLSAEEATALITVSDGFEVTLFAGEPDVQQPISMTIDERGRVWVAENYTYAEAAVNFDTQYNDRVVILEDTDHDGRSDKRKVFWDSAKRLTSVEVGFGGVWVLAAPQLLFIPDRDHDDVPDGPPVVVLDGWNDGAVRHNIVNGLKWGPDGWLYGRHGILANSFVGKPGSTPSQRTELNCCSGDITQLARCSRLSGRERPIPGASTTTSMARCSSSTRSSATLWHLIPSVLTIAACMEPISILTSTNTSSSVRITSTGTRVRSGAIFATV